ncbi:Early nodulin-like protein 18 isoform 2 [Hibiscus syriacus]|uniref:Early nodulin-like protein 18 isoform 2 n=2 Tax=Hibiscus syriacus TaxID=106335 RepID=A0A6A2XQ11_HIBSY|nr:Early nodulin-like protein 18 isoform 2 [Hibiscus syriacus]
MASNPKLILTLLGLLITTTTVATAYTNHTVGGDAGWFFQSVTNTSATNYTSWATNQTFNLGDYLIFRTSTNQTVIQTYNETTYRNCTTDDALGTDTFQYNGGNTDFDQAMTVAVPLTIEGANYYFSDGDDGVQCQHGLAFEILVRHGNGLPPSLNQPPPPPYVEPPSDTAQSPPATINGGTPSLNNDAVGCTDTRAILYSVFFGVTSLMITFMC